MKAQFGFSGGIGYGRSFSKAHIDRLNMSYNSYNQYLETNNPGMKFQADDEFLTEYQQNIFSVHAGLSGDFIYYGMSYFPNSYTQ